MSLAGFTSGLRFRFIVLLATWMLGSGPQDGSARGRMPTNLERLASAADSAAALWKDRFGTGRRDTLYMRIPEHSDDGRSRFVLMQWMRGLEMRGIVAVAAESSRLDGPWSVFVSGASVAYVLESPKRWFRNDRLKRTAEVELSLFERTAGGTMRPHRLRAVCVDTIPRSALDGVEQGGLLLGRPERPRSGFWVRILESAAVAAAVLWTVYSFYSIRSK